MPSRFRCIEKCDEINESSSILDVGCGNGLFLIEMVGETRET